MRLALLLVALGCLGAARAQLPALPASCQGVVTSLTGLLGAQTEIDAACPKTATSCSEACKAALSKYASKTGDPAACLRDAMKLSPTTTDAQIKALEAGFTYCGLTATATTTTTAPQPSPSPSPAAQPTPVASPSPSPQPQPQPQPSPSPSPVPSPSPAAPATPALVPWEAVANGTGPVEPAPAPAPAAELLTPEEAAPAPAPEVAAFDDGGKAPALSTGAAQEDATKAKAISGAPGLGGRFAAAFAAALAAAVLLV